MLDRWFEFGQMWLSHRLYPPSCLLCGDPGANGSDLCAPCGAAFALNTNGCAHCALPLDPSDHPESICPECQRQPPCFDACHAPFVYQPPWPYLIGGLKYRGRLAQARLIGQLLLAAHLARPPPRPEVLLPVPLHPLRQRERGFNQTALLAAPLAKALNLTLETRLLARVKETPQQAGLQRQQRRHNLHNAFIVNELRGYRHLAIFDDVVTTGSTANELARALKQAGARRVDIWAVARTPDPHRAL